MKYINICECYKNVRTIILNPPSQRKIQKSNASIMRLMSVSIDCDSSGGHWTDHHYSGNSVTGFCKPVLGVLLPLCEKMEAFFSLEAVFRATNESSRQFCCCCFWCGFDYNLNRNTFHSCVIYFKESASVSSYGWYENIRQPACNTFYCREKSI